MLKIDLDYAKFIYKIVMLGMPLYGAGMVEVGYPTEYKNEFGYLFDDQKILEEVY